MERILATVLPVFLIVGMGWGTARVGWLDAAGLKGLNRFVFGFAAPALLFNAGTRGEQGGAGLVAVAFFLTAGILYAIILVVSGLSGRTLAQSGMTALDCVFGNTVMMGIPIIFAQFGQEGLSIFLIILALHPLLMLTTATIVAEVALHSKARPLHLIRMALLGVMRNPIVVAVLAGVAWNLTTLPMPGVMRRTLEMLGAAGPPAALFCLGASLVGFNLAAAWKHTLASVAIKLVVFPLAVFGMCRLFGLPPLETSVATITAALPTGANAFMLAARYGVGAAESGAVVLAASLLGVVTLSVLLALVG